MNERFERDASDCLCRLEAASGPVELAPEIHVAASALQIKRRDAGKRSFDLIYDFPRPIAAYRPQIRFHVGGAVGMKIHRDSQGPTICGIGAQHTYRSEERRVGKECR